jgi:hypothetical protein
MNKLQVNQTATQQDIDDLIRNAGSTPLRFYVDDNGREYRLGVFGEKIYTREQVRQVERSGCFVMRWRWCDDDEPPWVETTTEPIEFEEDEK